MQTIFDTELLVERKRRALAQAEPGADFLMQRVAGELEERLATVERRFARAATLFCVTDAAAQALRRSSKVDEIVRIEADPVFLDEGQGIVAAPETLPLEPESLDLAVSLLALNDMNDVPGMLAQVRRALSPDGLFLAATAGTGTLAELRASLLAAETELSGGASPRVNPFIEVRDAGALLQRAGFALPVTDIDTLTVRYDTMFHLLRDLRGMGATNVLAERSRKPVGRSLFARAAEIYAERFSDPDGRVRATFEIVWMSGWAPHASQQKPLRPGSAKMSLADALKAKGTE